MDSANIQRGLNSPLNEVSFKLPGQARFRGWRPERTQETHAKSG
ncbi:MAG: hypothetical protein AB1815_13185 [Bacillota bacterium]